MELRKYNVGSEYRVKKRNPRYEVSPDSCNELLRSLSSVAMYSSDNHVAKQAPCNVASIT